MTKVAHQVVDKNGKPVSPAVSTPEWFVKTFTDIQVEDYKDVASTQAPLTWGTLFSEPQGDNAVEFFTTGADYFEKVSAAISNAKSSVFITGWQINYDVELFGKKTLFHCLQDAMKGGATIYVMPWFSPKAGVDTGDFETMLAVFHLNAGATKGRAYCLPAIQQGDQNTLGIFFAHHQKCVVIDNKKAFTGGIDLAYGRRDDGNFPLKANGRTLNEFYNTCIPPIDKLTNVAQQHCVTRMELLAAGLTTGMLQSVATFATSPSEGVLAQGLDKLAAGKSAVQDAAGGVIDAWNNTNLLPDIIGDAQDAAIDAGVDAAQGISLWAWQQLGTATRARLENLRATAGGNASNAAAAVAAWLNNADLSALPPALIQETSHIIQALAYGVVAGMQSNINKMPKRYERLFEKVKMTPKNGTVLDASCQPRMPWHDVQCCIEGPSVYDLSQNFVLRWNSVALNFERSFARYRDPVAATLLKSVGIVIPATPKAPRIQTGHIPVRNIAKKGGNRMQVLRSAPKQLLTDEAAAQTKQPAPTHAQNNCLKGMLKAISGAQYFIYIEGQFFQSAYGADGATDPARSGPTAAMLDIRRSPGYEQFADLLKIRDVELKDMLTRIRWTKFDNLRELPKFREFESDLQMTLKNLATIEAMRLMGKPQDRLKNPINKALINRIGRAINDERPFHVYMVLPVHPEGTLNTLNIMTQTHLTMHSLVFGDHSLINGIRRAILIKRYRKDKKMSLDAAKKAVAALKPEDVIEAVRDDWQKYLTLLNLRNWDTIGDKPVTEQIYVHSKLLIADDRVAIIGSANINDRSQLGDRDSELAVIVTDETKVNVKLDGVREVLVAASVHKLRRALWEKIFGLKSTNRKATALASSAILDSPGAPKTWREIQGVAKKNAEAYEAAFWFIPRSGAHPSVQAKEKEDKESGPPGSLWPTWHYTSYLNHEKGGRLLYRMPFDELFWRKAERTDMVSTWNVSKDAVNALAPVAAPEGVQGFIVALPINWTARENNQSGMNLTVLAAIELEYRSADWAKRNQLASADTTPPEELPG